MCTFLEPEEACYPDGGLRRKFVAYLSTYIRDYGYVDSGFMVSGRCGIPDTFFSIPGFAMIKGKRVRGYIVNAETRNNEEQKLLFCVRKRLAR